MTQVYVLLGVRRTIVFHLQAEKVELEGSQRDKPSGTRGDPTSEPADGESIGGVINSMVARWSEGRNSLGSSLAGLCLGCGVQI